MSETSSPAREVHLRQELDSAHQTLHNYTLEGRAVLAALRAEHAEALGKLQAQLHEAHLENEALLRAAREAAARHDKEKQEFRAAAAGDAAALDAMLRQAREDGAMALKAYKQEIEAKREAERRVAIEAEKRHRAELRSLKDALAKSVEEHNLASDARAQAAALSEKQHQAACHRLREERDAALSKLKDALEGKEAAEAALHLAQQAAARAVRDSAQLASAASLAAADAAQVAAAIGSPREKKESSASPEGKSTPACKSPVPSPPEVPHTAAVADVSPASHNSSISLVTGIDAAPAATAPNTNADQPPGVVQQPPAAVVRASPAAVAPVATQCTAPDTFTGVPSPPKPLASAPAPNVVASEPSLGGALSFGAPTAVAAPPPPAAASPPSRVAQPPVPAQPTFGAAASHTFGAPLPAPPSFGGAAPPMPHTFGGHSGAPPPAHVASHTFGGPSMPSAPVPAAAGQAFGAPHSFGAAPASAPARHHTFAAATAPHTFGVTPSVPPQHSVGGHTFGATPPGFGAPAALTASHPKAPAAVPVSAPMFGAPPPAGVGSASYNAPTFKSAVSHMAQPAPAPAPSANFLQSGPPPLPPSGSSGFTFAGDIPTFGAR